MTIKCSIIDFNTGYTYIGNILSLPKIGNRFILFDPKTNQPILKTTSVTDIQITSEGIEITTFDSIYTIS